MKQKFLKALLSCMLIPLCLTGCNGVKNDAESTQESGRGSDQCRQEIDGSIRHGGHIGIQPVQQITAAVRFQCLPAGPKNPAVSHMLHLIADPDMDGGTDPGGNSLEHQAAQHHHRHQGGRALQQTGTKAGDRVDEILGSNTGSKSHQGAHHTQNADQQNLPPVLVHPGQQPEQFPIQLLGIFSMEFFL